MYIWVNEPYIIIFFQIGSLAPMKYSVHNQKSSYYMLHCFNPAMNILQYTFISSSSSCRAGSTDIPDPLSPLFPIVHRLRQFFWTTSRILT